MKLGRNDPCWCNSGKKYKKCHLDREKETPARRGKWTHIFGRGARAASAFRLEPPLELSAVNLQLALTPYPGKCLS
jgi:hypothetical protein